MERAAGPLACAGSTCSESDIYTHASRWRWSEDRGATKQGNKDVLVILELFGCCELAPLGLVCYRPPCLLLQEVILSRRLRGTLKDISVLMRERAAASSTVGALVVYEPSILCLCLFCLAK